MNEQDLKMIGEMVEAVVAVQRQELRQFKDEVIDRFDRAIGATEDNLQHKLDLVVEGQQMLAERFERLEGRVEHVELMTGQQAGQLQGIAVSLNAHRADTEVHSGYQVRED
ncbi:MAG: hypothetical protein RQ722_10395 [Desulfuromonadales bacterium]|nr:hypothetical protein [Desulfuromonadales bacterium]